MDGRRLHPEIRDFLLLGLSMYVGACDREGRPQLTRALAVRALADGRAEMLVPGRPGAPLLRAVDDSGQVAAVFCQPTSHRTLQMKGGGAGLLPAEPADWPQLSRNLQAFAGEIEPFGFDIRFAEAWFETAGDRLFAVRFTPTGAWNQTPGPGAGAPMALLEAHAHADAGTAAMGHPPTPNEAVVLDAPPATAVPLSAIRRMLEGVIPGVLCTVSRDGVPHLCYLSQADYLDPEHVALSFQFFNRSRENLLATRRAALCLDDPYTAAGVRLQVEYLRTETAGPLFERMNAKLAGIASHSGMDKVFRLQGADIFRVHEVTRIEGRRELAAPRPRCDIAPAIRVLSERLAAAADTAQLLDVVMTGLREQLLIEHAMLLMLDPASGHLYAIASRGYDSSGVGAEIALGQGVAGIAAREGVPIRIGHLSLWKVYGQAMRERSSAAGLGAAVDEAIPLPGLAEPRSQMAVPLKLMGRVVGVLLLESGEDQHFSYDDEDGLSVLATQLALQLHLLQGAATEAAAPPLPEPAAAPAASSSDSALVVRHHPANDSIFVGNDYLIKGVAGAIFRKLVADHLADGRVEFSNRELRLDPTLGLPEVADNLEVRLLLLQRRLQERGGPVQIEKTGRGRFRLATGRALRLETMGG